MTGVSTTEFIISIVFGALGLMFIRRGSHVVGIILVIIAALAIAPTPPAQYVNTKVNQLVSTLIA